MVKLKNLFPLKPYNTPVVMTKCMESKIMSRKTVVGQVRTFLIKYFKFIEGN